MKSNSLRNEYLEQEVCSLEYIKDICEDCIGRLCRIKERLTNYQWDLCKIVNDSLQHKYIGDIVLSNMFEGNGADIICNKVMISRQQIKEETVKIFEIIRSMEAQIKSLQNYVSEINCKLVMLNNMLYAE